MSKQASEEEMPFYNPPPPTGGEIPSFVALASLFYIVWCCVVIREKRGRFRAYMMGAHAAVALPFLEGGRGLERYSSRVLIGSAGELYVCICMGTCQ